MQGFILRAEAIRSSQISRKDQRAITHRVVRLGPAWYDLKSTSASNTPSRANVIYDLLLRPLFLGGRGEGGGGGRAKSRGGTYSVHNYLELEANRQVLKIVLSPKSLYFGGKPNSTQCSALFFELTGSL